MKGNETDSIQGWCVGVPGHDSSRITLNILFMLEKNFWRSGWFKESVPSLPEKSKPAYEIMHLGLSETFSVTNFCRVGWAGDQPLIHEAKIQSEVLFRFKKSTLQVKKFQFSFKEFKLCIALLSLYLYRIFIEPRLGKNHRVFYKDLNDLGCMVFTLTSYKGFPWGVCGKSGFFCQGKRLLNWNFLHNTRQEQDEVRWPSLKLSSSGNQICLVTDIRSASFQLHFQEGTVAIRLAAEPHIKSGRNRRDHNSTLKSAEMKNIAVKKLNKITQFFAPSGLSRSASECLASDSHKLTMRQMVAWLRDVESRACFYFFLCKNLDETPTRVKMCQAESLCFSL